MGFMDETALCPFSKPIIGRWCRCEFARVADPERCAGKMTCTRAGLYRERCVALNQLLRERARFVLGTRETGVELTHAQSMKIRCGGLLGMQRVLALTPGKPPVVLAVIDLAEERYGSLENFPFNEIVQDIRAFSHRKKASDRRGDTGE